jgi:hypothetical protein
MALQLFKIADVTVGSPQATVTFSDIPSGYTDLKIVVSARTNRSGQPVDTIKITFNGNTSSYSNRGLGGTGSVAFSFTNAGSASIEDNAATTADAATANTFGNGEIYIPNYTSSNNKSVSTDGVGENNATASYQFMTAGLWANSAAITSISLAPLVGTAFTTNSTFTLYGVL